MSRQCKVPSCYRPTGGFSTMCTKHKSTERRHGHPEQGGLTVAELAPYRLRVRARVAINKDNPTWGYLQANWKAAMGYAETQIRAVYAGAFFIRHEVKTWEALLRIDQGAAFSEVLEVALAMFLYREEKPYRFESDKGFDAQLVRRVRTLAPVNAGSYYNHKTGKVQRVYRDLPPRTRETLAGVLRQIFAVAGLTVSGLEMAEQQAKVDQKGRFHAALADLQ